MSTTHIIIDGNEAAVNVAYQVSEVCAIYPITPSSSMGELADQWSNEGRKNIWGTAPHVVAMQSEGGAAGAVHGALQTGALATTFTASQGLLLMIPNMYKIAGELTPAVFHVSARTVACQGLSIFGDHSDVMAVRQTGWAMLGACSVQETADMSLVAHAATLKTRIPFIHFFDGFRTSHEINKVDMPDDAVIRAMIDDDAVMKHRKRALNPDRPVVRGTAQNPDVFFQGRESVNPYYDAVPDAVQNTMDELAKHTGRSYKLFEYYGDPKAERVIVLMGSGVETVKETIDALTASGEKVGVITARLFRPFSASHFVGAIPASAKTIAVLDRTKEPGCAGEPLYQDVLTALVECQTDGSLPTKSIPRVICGRYGLASKEFTPSMVKAVFDEAEKDQPKNHFTVGINDDVSHTSLELDSTFITEQDDAVRAVFYGLGADGTVGANKNSIKIIGEETGHYAQGYFVYDSKKAGSQTVSHLRFGPKPIRSTYLVQSANFIGCHQFEFLKKTDVLKTAAPNTTFLLNSPYSADDTWNQLPNPTQQKIVDLNISLYVIDAYKVARDTGMGSRINTIMQTCFFAISGVLPKEKAIEAIKKSIEKTYAIKGRKIVETNFAAVDHTVAHLYRVTVPKTAGSGIDLPPVVSPDAPAFVQDVIEPMIAGRGNELPVSHMPVDGTFPLATTQWEKRNISNNIPVWDEEICIQCGMCGMVCPHSVIRSKTYDESAMTGAPKSFRSAPLRGKNAPPGMRYSLQVFLEDCTGCGLCVGVCPSKNKKELGLRAINMEAKAPVYESEVANTAFFETIKPVDTTNSDKTLPKELQYMEPLFEFSGACSGCGETPYIKILTQLFGDRLLIANATGCSSIYGGNLPTAPWATDQNGRGPAWSNSLFEDNAEFGFGYRLTLDKHTEFAAELLKSCVKTLGEPLVDEILNADQQNEAGIQQQRERIQDAKKKLADDTSTGAKHLLSIIDCLVDRSVWIVGGDGWAYDIGFGGLDHVLASGRNVNILVLDTEVYSNTGGQMSKSTPRAAVAKYAAGGKQQSKKYLVLLAMSYENVYVSRIAMGANPRQTLRAFVEAEQYPGPSLILAYSHCIAHGIEMANGLKQQKLAVDSAYWPLYRFNPERIGTDNNPFSLDSKPPKIRLREYAYNEVRYRMIHHTNPDEAARLLKLAEQDVKESWAIHEELVQRYEPEAKSES